MKSQQADYQVVTNSKLRRFMAGGFRLARHKSMMHGLVEVDVTRPRAVLREHHARTGETLSFTAFLVACVAKAVDENKAVQAFRQGRKRLVLFDEVAVYCLMEREVAGHAEPVPFIIRAANHKTVRALHEEIRAAQASDANDILKGPGPLLLPAALFWPFLWAFDWIAGKYPRLWKRFVGTVGITSVGMFGKGAGWGIPPATPNPLMVTVGGIGEKQMIVNGQMTVREYLSLTLSFDHEVVDGAPAARFTRRLKELIESGYGLDEFEAASERTGAEAARKQMVAAAHIPTGEKDQ